MLNHTKVETNLKNSPIAKDAMDSIKVGKETIMTKIEEASTFLKDNDLDLNKSAEALVSSVKKHPVRYAVGSLVAGFLLSKLTRK